MRLGVVAVLLGWFGWYAYLRLTVEPPIRVEDVYAGTVPLGPPEPGDVTAELTTLVLALTAEVPFTLPPPEGMAWKWRYDYDAGHLSIEDITRGPWTPADRPNLRAVIAHLEDDATRERLAALRALRGRPWHYDQYGFRRGTYEGISLTQRRAAVKLLTSDARYQHAERGDLAAAWEDVQTAIWLSRPVEVETLLTVLLQAGCARLFLPELQHMSREHIVDGALAADIDRVLRQWPSPRQTWPAAMNGEEAATQRLIDACFTRDGTGQGWYVLSRRQPLLKRLSRDTALATAGQLPLWNLASVLYNDRRTVETKRAAYYDLLRSLPELPYADALAVVDEMAPRGESFTAPESPFTSLDGGVLHLVMLWSTPWAYEDTVATYAAAGATRLTLALSRFKSEHGVYPETLAELVPTCIPDLPLDPFADGPFQYRRDGDTYVLYSRGDDGVDDGGKTWFPDRTARSDPDTLYSYRRPRPLCEPELVPIGESATEVEPEEESEESEP
ncbi:MAG: hypothetical protein PVJ57_10875 [Phycisphaerae bacterium]|jgi:hypothetical protein